MGSVPTDASPGVSSFTPLSTDPVTSRRMSRQRTRDTAPEMALRSALHRLGYRYRVNAPVPSAPRRRADLLFPRQKVAVFVDGCFWHGCPQHATWPVRNAAWWESKLKANLERDLDTTTRLEAIGWTVVRIWEHTDLDDAVALVMAHLPSRTLKETADLATPTRDA